MNNYIKSPLNYTGGKYKLLKTILPMFPSNINTFVDLFAGGLNVGVNVNANTIVANDQITYLIDMFQLFQNLSTETIIREVNSRINSYGLSQTNTEAYNKLREKYNLEKDILDLFILTCYSFNHQIRFNNSHNFNTPFGKERSSYNTSIEKNLIRFSDALKSKNIVLSSKDFRCIDIQNLGSNDMVYCDPPYLITNGSYNDGKRGFKDWKETDDFDLLSLLDELNDNNVNFALSNVFYHKGLTNEALIKWSKKYNVNFIDKSYSNCSYHFKDRATKTVEVLITNYEVLDEQ